jgi:hypothetical protein
MSSSNIKQQNTMFGTYEFPSYEEVMESYTKEFASYVIPKGDTTFRKNKIY